MNKKQREMLAIARESLVLLREGRGNPGSLMTVRDTIALLHATPRILKTSKKELRSYERVFNVNLAKNYLDLARKMNGSASNMIMIRTLLARERICPESIGTTRQEMAELYRKGNLQRASYYVQKLREGVGTITYVWAIRALLHRHRAKPEDIGSTKKELRDFERYSFPRT